MRCLTDYCSIIGCLSWCFCLDPWSPPLRDILISLRLEDSQKIILVLLSDSVLVPLLHFEIFILIQKPLLCGYAGRLLTTLLIVKRTKNVKPFSVIAIDRNRLILISLLYSYHFIPVLPQYHVQIRLHTHLLLQHALSWFVRDHFLETV